MSAIGYSRSPHFPVPVSVPTPIRAGQRALRRVLRKGLVDSIRWGLFHAIEWEGDRRLGVDTAADEEWGPEAYRGTSGNHYLPLPYAVLRNVFRDVRRSCGGPKREVFFDYGSGKGRAVLAAARHPFKRVFGVELVQDLNEVARSNIAAAKGQLRAPVDVVTADAKTFVVPDDVTVVYLYNPFLGDVLSGAQQEIARSLSRKPRALRIYYAYPVEVADSFRGLPWVTSSRALSTGVLTNHYLVVHEHLESRSVGG